MGNGLSPCISASGGSRSCHVELVHWGGTTELISAEQQQPLLVEELMFRFPDRVICRSDLFFLGCPPPVLGLADALLPSRTYFLLPVDRLPCQRDPLTVASLAALSSGGGPVLTDSGPSPFAYVKGDDGRVLINVLPEFIKKVISNGGGAYPPTVATLCSTPELQKHYEQLVGAVRDRPWSPALETISECKKRRGISPNRLSPVRLIGSFEKKQQLNCCSLYLLSYK